MRVLVVALVIVTTLVTPFVRLQADTASACTCFIPQTTGEIRESLEQQPDLTIMRARVESVDSGRPYVSWLKPIEVFRGDRRARYEVESTDCNGIIADFQRGDEWFVQLSKGRDHDYRAHGCSSFRVNSQYADAYLDNEQVLRGSSGTSSRTLAKLGIVGLTAAVVALTAVWLRRRNADPSASG